jgi:hypothetical protein
MEKKKEREKAPEKLKPKEPIVKPMDGEDSPDQRPPKPPGGNE